MLFEQSLELKTETLTPKPTSVCFEVPALAQPDASEPACPARLDVFVLVSILVRLLGLGGGHGLVGFDECRRGSSFTTHTGVTALTPIHCTCVDRVGC